MRTNPILAFDCATSPASVALRVGERVVAEWVVHGRQASQLLPVMDRLLRENHIHYNELDSIVTTIGPGSFTGLRIALAALHGLVLAQPTPVRLLTTTEAVAWAIALRSDAPHEFIVALDAGKGEVFAQMFTVDNARPTATSPITTHPTAMMIAPKVIKTDEHLRVSSFPESQSDSRGIQKNDWIPLEFCKQNSGNDGVACFSNALPSDHPHYISGPDAAVLARIAEHIPVKPLAEAVPYYIRDADAKLPTASAAP